jgi:2-iminobutanoate/2-iminopropanoate deaminase
MKRKYSGTVKRTLWLGALLALFIAVSAFAQNQAIGFKKGMPFSEGYVAGNTL